MTVKELKKALRGVPDNLVVWVADHDQDPEIGELNGSVSSAEVCELSDWREIEPEWRDMLEGGFFVIKL